MDCPYCQKKLSDKVRICKFCGGAFDNQRFEAPLDIGDHQQEQALSSLTEIQLPGIFKRTIVFQETQVQYKNQNIKYADIRWLSYHSIQQSINLVPLGVYYSFKLGTDLTKISVDFSSLFYIGDKKCKAIFQQLISYSSRTFESIIIQEIYHTICNSTESIKIGKFILSKDGFKVEQFMRKAKDYSWNHYYGYTFNEGVVHIYAPENKLISSVPMMVKNAVVLPNLMAYCSQKFRK